MIGINTKAGLVMQALYYFGKNYFDKPSDDDILRKIKTQLRSTDVQNLQAMMPMTPIWMQRVIKRIII